jgi:hypothetical protein
MTGMLFYMRMAENPYLIIICGILALLAIIFFIAIYAIDFKDSRKRAKNKREQHRALMQAQKKKRNSTAGNVLSRES